MSITLARCTKLLESIPNHPSETSTEQLRQILEDHGLFNDNAKKVSNARTVRELLEKIMVEQPSVEVTRTSKGNFYQIAQGQPHPVNPDRFSSTMILQLIEEQIKTMLPPVFKEETKNLFNQISNKRNKRYELWKKHFCYVTTEFKPLPSEIDHHVFSTIEMALQNKRDLVMDYRAKENAPMKKYLISPKGIVLNGLDIYLVAYSHTSSGYRNFALHRIKQISSEFPSSTDNSTERFCLHTYVSEDKFYSGDKCVQVVLKIDRKNGSHFLWNKKISANQKTLKENEHYVEILVELRDSFDLTRWLIKNADIIQVVSPLSLRKKVIESLETAAKLYQAIENE
ncbi:helix-turn-helix transcriptional regulator [Vibrio sp. 1F255]|uniref:helix-turn-helix transcriptional regulator n=1 Tax=Vibrio sp. 1F255 TaxID=3230009 RepID=UPI00352BF125